MSASHTVPVQITRSDSLRFTVTAPGYTADEGWALQAIMLDAAGAHKAIVATAAADAWEFSAPPATTGDMSPGLCRWTITATRGTGPALERYTLVTGALRVLPALSDATAPAISHARRVLDMIEATIEGRASSATQEYQIGGRALKYIPLPDLLTLRRKYRDEVAAEDLAAGLVPPGHAGPARFMVRFGE